jgi:hypothetical protein
MMTDPGAPRPLPQIEIDAAMVASALGLTADEFRQLMDSGRIRTLSERGTGADSGQFRLSFWHGKRRYQLVTDAEGRVVARSVR